MKNRSLLNDIIGAVNEYKKININRQISTQGEGLSTQSTSNHNLSKKIKVSNINLKENSIKLAPYNTKKIKKIPYKVTSLNYGGGSVKNSVPLLNIKKGRKLINYEEFMRKNGNKSIELLRAEIMIEDKLNGTKNIDLYDQFIKETKFEDRNLLLVKYMFEDYVDKKNGNTGPVSDPLLQQKINELNKKHDQFRKEKKNEILKLTTSNRDNSKTITELNNTIKAERDKFLKNKNELDKQIQNIKTTYNLEKKTLEEKYKRSLEQTEQPPPVVPPVVPPQTILPNKKEEEYETRIKTLEERQNKQIEELQTKQKEEMDLIIKEKTDIEKRLEKEAAEKNEIQKILQKEAVEKGETNRKVQSIDKDVKEISKTLQENLDILSNLSGKPIQQGGSNILYQIDLTTFKTELEKQENNKYIGILKQLYETLNGIKEQQEAEEKVAATTLSEEKTEHEKIIKDLKEKLKKLNEEKERRKQEETKKAAAQKAQEKAAEEAAQEKAKRLKEQKAAEEAAQEKEKRLKEQQEEQLKRERQAAEERKRKQKQAAAQKAEVEKRKREEEKRKREEEEKRLEEAHRKLVQAFQNYIDFDDNNKKSAKNNLKFIEGLVKSKKTLKEKLYEYTNGTAYFERELQDIKEYRNLSNRAGELLANIMDLKKQPVDGKIIWQTIDNKTKGIKEFSNMNKEMKSYIVELEKEVKQLKSRGPPRGSGEVCPGKKPVLQAFDDIISWAKKTRFTNNANNFKNFAYLGRKNTTNNQIGYLQYFRNLIEKKGIDNRQCNDDGRKKIRAEIAYTFWRLSANMFYGNGESRQALDIKKQMQILLESISTDKLRMDSPELEKHYQNHNRESHFQAEGTIEESDSSDLISESSNLITINNSSIEQQGGKRKIKSNDKINKMKYKLFQKLVSKNLI